MNTSLIRKQAMLWFLSYFLACALAGAEQKNDVKIYFENREDTKSGIWLHKGESEPEFLYKIKIFETEREAQVDIGERPKLLAASLLLGNDRIALVVNNRLQRDAHFVLVIVKRDNNGAWRVVKEQGVLEKRDFQIKVPPRTIESIKLSTTKEGKIRIECPVEGIGKVKGEDGAFRLQDTGIRELVEEVDL